MIYHKQPALEDGVSISDSFQGSILLPFSGG